MNFRNTYHPEPVRVFMINPLSAPSQLLAVKILQGRVFGFIQPVDLILLVYSNELDNAEDFKIQLINCAFTCTNNITITSDLPKLSDADVFCFITNFPNPNYFDFEKPDCEDQFDSLYLIIKIARHFFVENPTEDKKDEDVETKNKKSNEPDKVIHKPMIVTDGLVALDILVSLSSNIPVEYFFCCTPLQTIARGALGEHLKIRASLINHVLVWAANDKVFYIEVEKPLVLDDEVGDKASAPCEWDMVGRARFKSFQLDASEFHESWMKKELLEKVADVASKNPYGCISKCFEFANTLKHIWLPRSQEGEGQKFYRSVGIISDGSLGTIKGYPYVLPLIFSGESWVVDKRWSDHYNLKQEVKRLNKAAKEHHDKLIPYCNQFLAENVIKQSFVPAKDDSTTSLASSFTNTLSQ